jgi:hypothetical protein
MARSNGARGALLAILAGIAAGVSTSVWLASTPGPRPEPRSVDGPVEVATWQAIAPHRIYQTESPQQPPDLDVRARLVQEHRDAIEAHRRQPVDPRWAAETGRMLDEDLARLGAGEGRFQVLGVDCRTSGCTAELEWPSYPAAVERHVRVLHEPYRVNCARRVTLPEPAGAPSAPYRATIVFDCPPAR